MHLIPLAATSCFLPERSPRYGGCGLSPLEAALHCCSRVAIFASTQHLDPSVAPGVRGPAPPTAVWPHHWCGLRCGGIPNPATAVLLLLRGQHALRGFHTIPWAEILLSPLGSLLARIGGCDLSRPLGVRLRCADARGSRFA